MDFGPTPVADEAERATLRHQARIVRIQTVVAAVIATVASMILV